MTAATALALRPPQCRTLAAAAAESWQPLAAPALRVQPTMALEPRVPLGTWACVTRLRGVAPFRQGSDRPRTGPPRRRVAMVGAAQGARLRVVHSVVVAAVRRPGCVAAAVELDQLPDLPRVPPVPRVMGEVEPPPAAGAAESFAAPLGPALRAAPAAVVRAGAAALLAPVATAKNRSMELLEVERPGARCHRRPAGAPPPHRVLPVLPAQCLLQRQRRSVHRSSKDARHYRGEQE